MNGEDLTHLTDLPLPLLDPPICPSVCSPPFSTHHGTPCSWASIWVGTKRVSSRRPKGGRGGSGGKGSDSFPSSVSARSAWVGCSLYMKSQSQPGCPPWAPINPSHPCPPSLAMLSLLTVASQTCCTIPCQFPKPSFMLSSKYLVSGCHLFPARTLTDMALICSQRLDWGHAMPCEMLGAFKEFLLFSSAQFHHTHPSPAQPTWAQGCSKHFIGII